MNPEIKEQWATALESGEFRQGPGCLRSGLFEPYFYCCLGVLCELHRRHHGGEWEEGPSATRYLNQQFCLPDAVVTWTGLEDENPELGRIGATTANDGKMEGERVVIKPLTFPEIAALIREHL